MKTLPKACLVGLALASVAVAGAGCGKVTRLARGRTEIVLAPDAPKSTRFAAEELKGFLDQVFGVDVALATNAHADVSHVFVGASEWATQAGLVTNSLARDAFLIHADGRDVYIVGRDDATVDTRRAIYSPHTGAWDQLHEHATLFGVYEFLESHAGVRMYFPGELGTIIPRADVLEIPAGTRKVAPDCLERNYSWYNDGTYFEGKDRDQRLLAARKVQYQRNRMQTLYIPSCHGENGFNVLGRFSKTHPEYLAMKADGTRRIEPDIPFAGHLCHSSGVWNEMYEDILSYERGESPAVRGIAKGPRWPIMTFRAPWVDMMPQDGFVPCQCPACKAAYRTNDVHFATELIWGRTVELAERLRKAGSAIRVTQMAYRPYRRVPAIAIPDNVDVMVAETGPWSINRESFVQQQLDEIRGWAEKLGRPVWIWTYPGKYGRMALPSIPNPTPRSYVAFYQKAAPWIFGAYAENETDRWLYNYLSNYVFGKFCWKKDIDVEAILAEHFRLMFGPAAQPMADFVREMEETWINQVASRQVEGALGPTYLPPSDYDLFTSIYSPATLARWHRDYIEKARALVPAESLARRRIDLYEREFIVPLETRAKAYLDSISVEKELARRASRPLENFLVNGYMDLPPQPHISKRHYGKFGKGGWKGGWIGDDKTAENVSIVNEAPPGLPAAMKISVKDAPRTVCVTEYFRYGRGNLKPATKYRFSVFLKLEGVKPGPGKDGGGVTFRIWDGKNTFLPLHKMIGTMDWFHFSFERTTPDDPGKYPHTLSMYLWNAVGTVWFAGALFEEVK